jgi:hypothetical protein
MAAQGQDQEADDKGIACFCVDVNVSSDFASFCSDYSTSGHWKRSSAEKYKISCEHNTYLSVCPRYCSKTSQTRCAETTCLLLLHFIQIVIDRLFDSISSSTLHFNLMQMSQLLI